jgi:O-antigen biosynthesis protein
VHDNLCNWPTAAEFGQPGNFHPTPKISFEISSSIVRWYGYARIERFLNRLYQLAKQEGRPWRARNLCKLSDQDLSFLDLVCFNVYLESRDSWKRYLGRLQNLAGERPLLLAEVGLDTQRNGEVGQAQALRWLIQGAFASGCAGAFVFGWTDERYRGGFEILDWDFGLTRRDRASKAALETPGIYGGAVPGGEVLAQHLGCGLQLQRPSHHSGYLEGLATLRYPAFEVIVVDDGSSPPLEPLVAPYGFRTIRTLNRGLSAARNIGLEAAGG